TCAAEGSERGRGSAASVRGAAPSAALRYSPGVSSRGAPISGTRSLSETSLRRRYQSALVAVRLDPYDGDLLLSYVIWPDDMPTHDEIERIVRIAQYRRRREALVRQSQ